MPEGRRYTIAICKGAALLEETRTLLTHWQFGEPADAFAKRVEQQGLLGKATACRMQDIVRRVFIPRYLRPDNRPAKVTKMVLESNLRPQVFKELVLLYSARQDFLLQDFVLCEFWPSVRQGSPELFSRGGSQQTKALWLLGLNWESSFPTISLREKIPPWNVMWHVFT